MCVSNWLGQVESVKGYQGSLNGKEDVLACIKHFVGGSEPINGTNGSPTDLSERTLREVFFPPFKAGVEAVITSYSIHYTKLYDILHQPFIAVTRNAVELIVRSHQ